MSTLALMAGGLIGGGLAVATLSLIPAGRDLACDLALLTRTSSPRTGSDTAVDAGWRGQQRRWVVRLGRPAVPLLTQLGLPRPATRRDLALMERTHGDHVAEQASLAAGGAIVAPLLVALAVTTQPVVLLAAAAAGAAAAMLLVDHQVRRDASRRRTQMRAALSCLLDLVVLAVDGGAGIDQALTDAADTCAGWPGHRLAAALRTAHLTRTSVWDSLARLGAETGISELTELAATARLAGTEGARIRDSLTARAATLRARILAEAEAAGNRATEKVSLPMVVLAFGFVLLLAYPALAGLAWIAP